MRPSVLLLDPVLESSPRPLDGFAVVVAPTKAINGD